MQINMLTISTLKKADGDIGGVVYEEGGSWSQIVYVISCQIYVVSKQHDHFRQVSIWIRWIGNFVDMEGIPAEIRHT